jgi:hypothetical protein
MCIYMAVSIVDRCAVEHFTVISNLPHQEASFEDEDEEEDEEEFHAALENQDRGNEWPIYFRGCHLPEQS